MSLEGRDTTPSLPGPGYGPSKQNQLNVYIPDEMIPVTAEKKLYTLDNFIADVGGYLGLLLGVSALAVYHYLAELAKICIRKFSKDTMQC